MLLHTNGGLLLSTAREHEAIVDAFYDVSRDCGIVTEVVPDGGALARVRESAKSYLAKTDVTRRNTRIHF